MPYADVHVSYLPLQTCEYEKCILGQNYNIHVHVILYADGATLLLVTLGVNVYCHTHGHRLAQPLHAAFYFRWLN